MTEDIKTPEEKLLKLIENPSTNIPKMDFGIKQNIFKNKSFKEWFKDLIENKERTVYADIKTVHKVVSIICAILTVLCIFDFFNVNIDLKKRLNRIMSGGAGILEDDKGSGLEDVNVSDMVAQVKARNIFTFVAKKQAAKLQEATGDSNFKLVGILWSNAPQAMIEDTKEQRTHLLSVGDRIGKSIVVKNIFRDKVLLTNEGQEWELR